jgi:dipeptidyl aminopeptidase/acylaminoacyl peptidase
LKRLAAAVGLFLAGVAVGAGALLPFALREGETPASAPLDRRPEGLSSGALTGSASGLLAYLGTDGGVYVADPSTGVTVQVATGDPHDPPDAPAFPAGLAWSDDGRLLVANAATRLLVRPGRSDGGERLPPGPGQLIWAGWAAGCGDCDRVATIEDGTPEPGGDVVLRAGPAGGRSLLDQRAPEVYVTWAGPDRIVRHIMRPEPRLELVDLRTGAVSAVGSASPVYLAPTMAGDRVVSAVVEDGSDVTRVAVTAESAVLHVPYDTRRVVFAAAPDGRRVAFAINRISDRLPRNAFGPIYIADLVSGEVKRFTAPTFFTLAFAWSPDGARLAYLTWLDVGTRFFNQLRVKELAGRGDEGYAFFEPTLSFRAVATFFDQYIQSHSLWSPDGRYVAYAAVSSEGRRQIWLADTERGPEAQPILIGEGIMAAFSRS